MSGPERLQSAVVLEVRHAGRPVTARLVADALGAVDAAARREVTAALYRAAFAGLVQADRTLFGPAPAPAPAGPAPQRPQESRPRRRRAPAPAILAAALSGAVAAPVAAAAGAGPLAGVAAAVALVYGTLAVTYIVR